MKKQLPALIAAVVVTILVAFAMLTIGVNAYFNPNGVQASTVPGEMAPVSADSLSDGASQVALTNDPAAQIQQLEARIQEYQAREAQYQQQLDQARTELQQANSQIEQANQQVQSINAELNQYQQVVQTLEQMGVLRSDGNGGLFVPRFRGDDH